MDITRIPGKAIGRSSGAAWDKLVYAVATAGHVGNDVKPQTVETLAHIDRTLAAAGTDKTRILAATVYLNDMKDKPAMDELWNEWIGPEENWPQRACLGVDLANDDLVEIIVIAVRD